MFRRSSSHDPDRRRDYHSPAQIGRTGDPSYLVSGVQLNPRNCQADFLVRTMTGITRDVFCLYSVNAGIACSIRV